MSTTGPDVAVSCPGCGLVVGKFTAADGTVYTSKAAFEERAHP